MTRKEIAALSDSDVALLCTKHQMENVAAQRDDGYAQAEKASLAMKEQEAAFADEREKLKVSHDEEVAKVSGEALKRLAAKDAEIEAAAQEVTAARTLLDFANENIKSISDNNKDLAAKFENMSGHPDVIAAKAKARKEQLERLIVAAENAKAELEQMG